jgi:malate dehydrogenase (oxaloacetate-decarboxylating)(NADP+)
MENESFKRKVLDYHSKPRPGKFQISLTKPCSTQEDLSMAYTPGVAIPCEEIKNNSEDVWKYTSRSNMIAVISDGSAVLGLGDIGPRAGLPVMEGKSVLLKKFADVDSMPIVLQKVRDKNGKTDVEKFVAVVEAIEPSVGGINLEDVAAPACFELEAKLKKEIRLPIFHDDQHGTAIISLAGLMNGMELCGKKLKEIKVVINGAGAAGIACADYYHCAGVKASNIIYEEQYTKVELKG